ncbi:MAG: hypothetical protein Q8R47_01165 [Nanoarchaeota archaeon]|nr:hypothetical protein [Nanoarchaeota archaeon]
MGVVSKVFMMLIPLVVLFVVLAILFRPEEGLFDKAKGLILGAKDVLPTVSVGLEEQKADVTIPDVHREEIFKLRQTIQGMLGSGNKNCFANYGGISDLGEGGTSLKFDVRGDKTLLTVSGGAGEGQTIADLAAEFPRMKPCVIAGEGGTSKNFFTHFIEEKQLMYPYFTPVNSLSIFGGGSDYNGINIPELSLQSNLEDGGWLFTPDREHVCFFPTNKVANYDDDGIDNNYFALGEENSIQNRINQEKLQYCRSEETLQKVQ